MIRPITIFLCLLLLIAPAVIAQDISVDVKIKELCNDIILSIYEDILDVKYDYPELRDFGQHVLSRNQYGINVVNYRFTVKGGPLAGQTYAFGITVVKMDDDYDFGVSEGLFNFGFPLLDLKFSGYQIRSLRKKQFDILDPLQHYGQVLLDVQQKYMPLSLTMEAAKDVFHTGEPIEYNVRLTNQTNTILQVKDLSAETLFCVYGDTKWGAEELAPGEERDDQVVIRPQESISKRFRGSGFSKPQQFNIICSYELTYQGVAPDARLPIVVAD